MSAGLASRIAASMKVDEKLTKREMSARVGERGTGASTGVASAVRSLVRRRVLVECGFRMERGCSVRLYERREAIHAAKTISVEPCGACGLLHDDNEATGFRCRECNTRVTRCYLACFATRLRARKLCLRCDHWLNLLALANDSEQAPRCVRIAGHHYLVGDEPAAEALRSSIGVGFSGREIWIRFNDECVVKTRNLWHQGEVPTRFKDRLPDNARFVAPDERMAHA
jgi:hypothetical protein